MKVTIDNLGDNTYLFDFGNKGYLLSDFAAYKFGMDLFANGLLSYDELMKINTNF